VFQGQIHIGSPVEPIRSGDGPEQPNPVSRDPMLQALTQSGTGVFPELAPIPPALLVALQEEGEWGVGGHTGKGKAITRRRGDAEGGRRFLGTVVGTRSRSSPSRFWDAGLL